MNKYFKIGIVNICSITLGYGLLNFVYTFWGSMNLFDWTPEFSILNLILFIISLICLVGIWKISYLHKYKVEIIILLILSFYITYHGIIVLPTEPLSKGWLGRDTVSPPFFRILIFFVLLMPSLIYLYRLTKCYTSKIPH